MVLRSFAVAGAGGMGSEVVRALLNVGANVIVLSRAPLAGTPSSIPTSAMEALAQSGRPAGDLDHSAGLSEVRRVHVDYANEDSLVEMLQSEHIEVVISTLRGGGFLAQTVLARAAKRAGVELFVPSEYGVPTTGRVTGTSVAIHLKTGLQETLKQIGQPYAIFFNGLWTQYWPLILGLPNATNTATIVGDGNVKVSMTARPDVARFMAHVLTTLSKDQLVNRVFRIEGDRRTVNEVLTALSSRLGMELQREYLDPKTTKAAALLPENDPAQYVQWLASEFAEGTGTVSFDAVNKRFDLPTDNMLWPEWNPLSLESGLPKQL